MRILAPLSTSFDAKSPHSTYHTMKLSLLLLPAALAFAACTADSLDEVPSSSTAATSQARADQAASIEYPQKDKSVSLNANATAWSVWKILEKFDSQRALTFGETEITDAQYDEIKKFVDEKLADETQYKTYRNIFSWIVKNVKYANTDGQAYLKPYDVYQYKSCVCQGYANLLKTMCLTQGIPCFIANGWLSTIGGHAWNYVCADGTWYVSDPTNNGQYEAKRTSDYLSTLIPQRLDLTLFEDDQFTYNYQDNHLNVHTVKPTVSASYVVVPWSVGGIKVTSFHPSETLPSCVSQVYLGANIATFGNDNASTTLGTFTKNVTEVNVDPSSTQLSSYKGVVYEGTSGTSPYFIPGGITRLELRPMKVMDKNVVTWLNNLEELVVADGTERIEAYAVEGCKNLKRIYVPESVTYIDADAFYNCGNPEIVRVSTSIHEITR